MDKGLCYTGRRNDGNERNDMTVKKTECPIGKVAADVVNKIITEYLFHLDDIQIEELHVGQTHLVAVQCNKADMPRIVGKGGAHATALQAIVAMIGEKSGNEIALHIVEPTKGIAERYGTFVPKTRWPGQQCADMIAYVAQHCLHDKPIVRIEDMPAFRSKLTIEIPSLEDNNLVAMFYDAIKVLWNAIGKMKGRYLFVDVVRV